jgi:hypothetical protein
MVDLRELHPAAPYEGCASAGPALAGPPTFTKRYVPMYTELGARTAHAASFRERGNTLPGVEQAMIAIAGRPRVSARDERSMQAAVQRWLRDTAARSGATE